MPHGNTIQFTPDMDDAIRTLRADGHHWHSVAARVGVYTPRVMQRARELGISTKRQHGAGPLPAAWFVRRAAAIDATSEEPSA